MDDIDPFEIVGMMSPFSAGAPAPVKTPHGASQSTRSLVVSDTFERGADLKVDLFSIKDKCCLCIVALNELGVEICGGLIGNKREKICPVEKIACAIATHQSLKALCTLSPKAVSS